jgi:hypothetical protein
VKKEVAFVRRSILLLGLTVLMVTLAASPTLLLMLRNISSEACDNVHQPGKSAATFKQGPSGDTSCLVIVEPSSSET